jgi:hypothetical protein
MDNVKWKMTFGRACSRSEKLMQASLSSRLIAALDNGQWTMDHEQWKMSKGASLIMNSWSSESH